MEKKDNGEKPFERMRDLARRIVNVPKAEIERNVGRTKRRRRQRA